MELASQPNNDLLFILLLVILGGVAFFVQQYPKLFLYYWKSSVGNNQSFLLERDESQSSRTIGFGIDVMSLLVFGLFCGSIAKIFSIEILNLSITEVVLYSAGGYGVIILMKKTLIWFLGLLFNEPNVSEIHRTQITVNSRVLSLVLIPIAAVGLYAQGEISKYFLLGGLVICALQYVLRFFKLLITGFKVISLPKYFSILYLCTLEILPVLLLVKWLS